MWRGMRKERERKGRTKRRGEPEPEPIFDNIKHGNLPETSGANRAGEEGEGD